MEVSLMIKGVSKSFGTQKVLVNIDLTCESNSVYSLLGRNGAGKSTLINLMAGLLDPDSGSITFNGLPLTDQSKVIKRNIGLVSQYEQVIGELNAADFLTWITLLYGLNAKESLEKIENLLSYFFDQGEDLNAMSKNYSSGMKKKLAFCAAVIHKPDFLFLDEPFANLDPVASNRLCDFLRNYQRENRVIFISSHDLQYIGKIATHIGIICDSKLIYNGLAADFKKENNQSLDTGFLNYLEKENDTTALLNSIT